MNYKDMIEKQAEIGKAPTNINEDLVRKAIIELEGPVKYDKKGNMIHLDDNLHKAYWSLYKQNPGRLNELKKEVMGGVNPYIKNSKPIQMNMKFGDIANEWFGDYKGLDKYKDSNIVLGFPERKRQFSDKKYGTSHILHNPNENKYYFAEFDNDVPSDYDLSRIQHSKIIKEIEPKWVDDLKAKGFLNSSATIKKAEIIEDVNNLIEKKAFLSESPVKGREVKIQYDKYNDAYGFADNELDNIINQNKNITVGELKNMLKDKYLQDINKTAFDIVNESFEKQAGLKDSVKRGFGKYKHVLTGRNIKNALNEKAFESQLRNSIGAKKNKLGNKLVELSKGVADATKSRDFELASKLKGEMNSLNPAFNKLDDKFLRKSIRIEELNKNIGREKAKTTLVRGATGAGALALTGAGAYGINKMRKKREKTAFEIINESFEKLC